MPETHRWIIGGLEKTMIKSDEPFIHNEAVWRLGLTYNRIRECTLKVTIAMVNNPLGTISNKIYYKRNEYFLRPACR